MSVDKDTVELERCKWCLDDSQMRIYHDQVWGVPVHDDRQLFAKLSLDLMQAGLSWRTILYKTQSFYLAFDDFDLHTVAQYNEAKIEELLSDKGIVRNKLKINAIINNARCILQIKGQYESFDNYLWQFVDGKPIKNCWTESTALPAKTELSDKISKTLLKQGFKFVGSTIVYSFMQAIGMVNDHILSCFRYNQLE